MHYCTIPPQPFTARKDTDILREKALYVDLIGTKTIDLQAMSLDLIELFHLDDRIRFSYCILSFRSVVERAVMLV